ncbi:S41 family peptidase [Undibacterium sp. Di24W]|uniref:S41 family peptidase n=1 Tax=Undibacterium sp. Di24W TaxID=3413033 RepID=UPI003BF25C3E
MNQLKLSRLAQIVGWLFLMQLSACGGNENQGVNTINTAQVGAPMQAAPTAGDVQVFPGARANYSITILSVGYIVTDIVGNGGSVTVKDKKVLKFADVTMNLEIADLANTIASNDLTALIDLYTAFFNRVPDADGLSYWIKQYKAGVSLDQISNNFYAAAIQYSAQTGYSNTMTPQEFVLVIYKNVLGRSGATAPPNEDVNYWVAQLAKGTSKGAMIRSMLTAARGFYNDATWSWVPNLLDNKMRVGQTFAVNQGLNYISPDESIVKTMAIAAAVTPTSKATAESMIPVKDLKFTLNSPPTYGNLSGICTPDVEKTWARGHLDDVYLWYNQIAEVPASAFPNAPSYFDALLVRTKDRFSFTSEQGEIDDFFQSGVSFSYGYSLQRYGTRLRVLFVEPGSPADRAGIKRGTTLAKVDNTSLEQPANDVQFLALYPSKVETHTFELMDVGASAPRTVSMTSASITQSPVLTSKVVNDAGKKFGYLVFNDHIRTAEQPLIDAMNSFKQARVDELVLDVRYNGGGYLYIANELASMIGGSKTVGNVFEQLLYNDKYPARSEASTTWFYQLSTTSRLLPQLNLKRVFVLTSGRTCSASESIINGLSPFMEVILIGENTCGKPYGFVQTNNCKTAYFAISFSGVNAKGEGDYVNGFAPRCKVADDLDHVLGDIGEKRLAAATSYAKTGVCPAEIGIGNVPAAPPEIGERDPYPWRRIRLVK